MSTDADGHHGKMSSLAVTLHPDSYPLRWESCGQLAEFVSHYTGLFFESPAYKEAADRLDRYEIEDAINYILLELIQNALKYNSGGDIDVLIEIHQGELKFDVTNLIRPDEVSKLESIFDELFNNDPALLLIQRIEENAENPEAGRSGLGFLTIMNDYGAGLAWRFEDTEKGEHVRLTVITTFPVSRSEI